MQTATQTKHPMAPNPLLGLQALEAQLDGWLRARDEDPAFSPTDKAIDGALEVVRALLAPLVEQRDADEAEQAALNRRIRHKLAAMLSKELGTYIDPGELQEAEGWWRSNPGSEALRWEGPAGIGSWSTMTDCVRYGIDIERGSMSDPTTLGYAYPIAVNAKAPHSK